MSGSAQIAEPVRDGQPADDAAPIEVMLIDNEDLVRRGFRQALEDASDITVTAEARVGSQALRVAAACRPRVILVDTGFPRQEDEPGDGTELIRQLALPAGRTGAGVVVLTSLDLDDYLSRTLKAGASGFLLKNISQEELVYAVRSVARGQAFICPEMTRRLIDRFALLPPPDESARAATLGRLSSRETQVLVGMATGRSNHEIAGDLHLAPATVKSHVSHIFAKLQLQNRMDAALLAYRLGLVHPPWSPAERGSRAGPSAPRTAPPAVRQPW